MASLLVTSAGHFVRGPDGHVYVSGLPMDYAFWRRYLTAFERVGVAVRVSANTTRPADARRADGDGVCFHDMPDFLGPWQYARARATLVRTMRDALQHHDCCCLRVPSWISTLAYRALRYDGRPFGVEVVGDPRDALATGAVRSIVRPVARWSAVRALRRQCRDACAAAYVTRETLQRRYPPAPGAFTTCYTSVDLTPACFADPPRHAVADPPRLVFVGSLEVPYKALDVLIRAVHRCREDGVRLTVVGDGRERPGLQRLSESLGLAERITFTGRLPPGKPIRDALDAADVFVLPSRTEGLPRAMLEAMARGLPCIGSAVGGIRELLPPDDLVPPGDVDALARKIVEVIRDDARVRERSRRNRGRRRQLKELPQ
ncbi:MAG: glycosyltransferase, partial [Phycisphaerae bacterium]